MKIETGTSVKYERARIPDETYIAEFTGTRDIKDGKFGPRVAFIFKVDYDGKSIELAKICYKKKATPKNDIGSVLLAFGVNLDGSEFDIDSLKGQKVRVVVEDYEYEDNGTKKIASAVQKVKPLAQKV